MDVLVCFVYSRLVLLLVTVAAALVARRPPLQMWQQWDSRWYLGIAEHGYHWGLHGKPALAFYPLLPALLRAAVWLRLPGLGAGIIIANVAFLAALLYLRALFALQWGERAAGRALLIVALFPTAFFTFAPYTEAPFLLAAAATLYHARRGESLKAGIWLAIAAVTRSTAVILIVPTLVLLEDGARHRTARFITWLLTLGPAAAAWTGFLCYLAAQHLSLSTLLRAQASWHRALTLPWTGFIASIQWLARFGLHDLPWASENLLQLGVTLLFLTLTAVAWRDLDRASRLYCAGFWLLVLVTPEWRNGYYAPFSSMDRFVLALFPLAGWATQQLSTAHLRHWLRGSALAMCAAAAVHLSGGWVG